MLLVYHAHVPRLRPLCGDEVRYHERAITLADGVYLEPQYLWPPLYEWFLSVHYWVLGDHRLPVELSQTALLVIAGLLLRRLLLVAELDPIAADAAMALLLLDPQVAAFAHYLWPEVPHLTLELAAVAVLVTGPEVTRRRAALAGLLVGGAVLMKALLWVFVPVMVAVAVTRSKGGWRDRYGLGCGAALILGVVVAVGPVVVLHGQRFGVWTTGGSAAFNLWVGLNDPSGVADYHSVPTREYFTYMESAVSPVDRNREVWRKVREKIEAEGVLPVIGRQIAKQYGRLLDRDSFFTDQLPRGRLTWGDPRGYGLSVYRYAAWGVYGLILVLVGFGVALPAPGARSWMLPAVFLAGNAGLFLLLHVKTRYRVAFMPALIFFAAVAVHWVVIGCRSGRRSEAVPDLSRRAVVGVVVATALVTLAFLN